MRTGLSGVGQWVDTGRQRVAGDGRRRPQLAGWKSAGTGARCSAPIPQPRPPAVDRTRPFFRAGPWDVAKVATGPPAQLLVGRQPNDRIGVSQTAYQGGNRLIVRLTTAEPDRPRANQGCRVLDPPKAARPVRTPPKGSHRGHQDHRPDPSADPHDSLPWFAGSFFGSTSAIRAGPLSSRFAGNSSQSWQNRQCQSGLPGIGAGLTIRCENERNAALSIQCTISVNSLASRGGKSMDSHSLRQGAWLSDRLQVHTIVEATHTIRRVALPRAARPIHSATGDRVSLRFRWDSGGVKRNQVTHGRLGTTTSIEIGTFRRLARHRCVLAS